MPDPNEITPSKITVLLDRARNGDSTAVDVLLPMVYAELHSLAHSVFRTERPGHTLQPTALVHEAWMKLAGGINDVQGRAQFFAIAATAMRQVLIDHARKHRAAKRGGGRPQVTLDDSHAALGGNFDLMAFEECLERLEQLSSRSANVVSLRVFGGMTVEEIAVILQVSTRTVDADWAMGRAWLRIELAGGTA